MTAPPRARILILAPNAPTHGLGGAERHLRDLALVLEPISAGVMFRSHTDAPPPGLVERILIRFEPMLASPLAVRRLLRQGLPDADVILSIELMGVGLKHPGHLHLFFGSYAGFRDMALPPASGLRAPIRKIKSCVARSLERRTQHKLGAVANSIGLRDVIKARSIPVHDEIVPPPTNCNRFCPGDKEAARAILGLPQDKRLILFAGRWEFAKGADRVTRILEAVPKDWHLVIATPSGYTSPPPSGSQVTILTDLETDRMIFAYRAADVLLQPSRFEGYSLVVSEAQACGCPVLTSPVGQAAHFLASPEPLIRTAVVTDPEDPNLWLTMLNEIVRSDSIQTNYAQAHRRYAEHNVSYPATQKALAKIFSEKFKEYTWQLH